MVVYDSSFQRPKPDTKHSAGDGLILYVSHDQTNPKVPSVAECDAYRAHGWNLGFVFEWYETRGTEGYASGVDDAHKAVQQASDRKHPRGKPLYVAHDTLLKVNSDYLRGIEDVFKGYYLPSLYSSVPNLEIARARKWAKLWLSASKDYSGGKDHDDNVQIWNTYPHAALKQLVGSPLPGTDENVVIDKNWNGGLIMPLSDSDAAMVWNHGLKNPYTKVVEPAVTRIFEIGKSITDNAKSLHDSDAVLHTAINNLQKDVDNKFAAVMSALASLHTAAGLTLPEIAQGLHIEPNTPG